MIHCSRFKQGNASEFILARTGKICVTSHGMGSGIYGVTQEYIQDSPPYQGVYGLYTRKMVLKNPYLVHSQDACDSYVHASTKLMESIQTDIIDKYKMRAPPKSVCKCIAKSFLCTINSDLYNTTLVGSLEKITNAIARFAFDYWFAKVRFVNQPIVYILASLGFDGVYSTTHGKFCDTWNKGNVKFIPIDIFESENIVIIARNGVQRIVAACS